MFNRFDSKMKSLKGGEMMKVLGLVLVMLFVVAGAVAAQSNATLDVYGQWNLVALPQVPLNSDPTQVFQALPDGVDNGNIWRMDAPSQSLVDYDDMNPGGFGGCVLGDGYQLCAPSIKEGTLVTTVSYAAVADGVPTNGVMTDMWISLPGYQLGSGNTGGWSIIGQPFAHVYIHWRPELYGWCQSLHLGPSLRRRSNWPRYTMGRQRNVGDGRHHW